MDQQLPLRKGSARVAEEQVESKREVLNINRFPLVVFLRKKFSRAESCAEELTIGYVIQLANLLW